jgi:NitT/TauT family transport system substrate-binding protein
MVARSLARHWLRRGAPRAGVATGVALLAVAALALSGCGSSGGNDDGNGAGTGGATGPAAPATITIAVQPIPDFAPVWLGVSQGIFKDAGLDVQVVAGTATSSGQIPLLSSGKADLAATTATAALQAAAQGIGVKIVAGLTDFGTSPDTDPSGLVVSPKSSISSYKDLDGKTVAISGLKSITQAGIQAAVKADGGDPDGVKFVQVPMPNIPAAVGAGSADAGFVVDPFLGAGLAKGLKLAGQPLSEVASGQPGTSLVATSSWADDHSDTLTKFVAALAEAADYANQNPDAVRQATATAAKVPVALLKNSKNPVFDATVKPDLLATEADLLHTYGALDKSVDAASLVWKAN